MKYCIFLLAMLAAACEYNPKSSYYIDLNRETYGNIAIDLLNQPDTIVLIQETNYSYNILLDEGQTIYNTEITVDGHTIISNGTSNGTLSLVPGDYETGSHVLKIDVVTNSGTGSISDLAGAELYYTREWILITDHTPPESLEITSITESDGRLRIEWIKNNNLNFQHYIVYRTLFNPITNSSNESGLIRICDADSNWFIDDSYVGGQVTYQILNTGMNISVSGIPNTFNGLYPKFLPEVKTEGDKVTFTWNKTRFPENFGNYELASRDKINYTFTTLFTSENPNDTSFIYTVPFGDSVDIWLNTVPEKVNYWYPETMTDRTTVYAGEEIPQHYSGLIHSNDPDIVYLLDYYSLCRYNLKTGLAERIVETNYNEWEHNNTLISPNGNYLVRVSDNTAYSLDPVSLNTVSETDLSHFYSNSGSLYPVALTNNGWLSVSVDKWPYLGGLVDLNTHDTIFTVKGYNYIRIYPSPMAKYLIISIGLNSALYQYDGSLTKLHDLGSGNFKFNSVNEEELFQFDPVNNSISILNCLDLTVIKHYIPPIAINNGDFDPVSGLIMVSGSDELFVFDLDENIVTNRHEIISSSYFYLYYAFFNNTLFSRKGYKLSLSK